MAVTSPAVDVAYFRIDATPCAAWLSPGRSQQLERRIVLPSLHQVSGQQEIKHRVFRIIVQSIPRIGLALLEKTCVIRGTAELHLNAHRGRINVERTFHVLESFLASTQGIE